YCRHKVYPLGLPNGISHALTAMALFVAQMFGIKASFLPPRARPVRITILQQGEIKGQFALLMVTTLQRLLLRFNTSGEGALDGSLKLLVVEQKPWAILRAAWAMLRGRAEFGDHHGLLMSQGNEIRIEGDRSSVLLDGELFEANDDRPIVLTPTQPVSFLSLAA
ncbi:MAG: diacylglycerol kinase, partial [Parasphingopyxis sp.]